MKFKYIFILAFSFASLKITQAQQVYQTISDETCYCISQYPVDVFPIDSLAKYTSLCIYESALIHQKKLESKKYSLDFTKPESMIQLAETMAPILQKNCPLVKQTEDLYSDFENKERYYLALKADSTLDLQIPNRIFSGQFLELKQINKKTQKLTLVDKKGNYQEFILPFTYPINSELLLQQKENVRVVYVEKEDKEKLKTKTILSIKLIYK